MTPTEPVWESQSESGVAGARQLEERRPTGQGSWEGTQPQPDLCPRLGQTPGNGAGFLGWVTEGQGPQLEGGNPKWGELGGQSGQGAPLLLPRGVPRFGLPHGVGRALRSPGSEVLPVSPPVWKWALKIFVQS